MLKVVSDLRRSAREGARVAAFTTIGALFTLVGIGFLTAALWMLVSIFQSPLYATTLIGALYCAAGFILMALGLRRKSERAAFTSQAADLPPTAPREPWVQLAEGFALGLQAGRDARKPGK